MKKKKIYIYFYWLFFKVGGVGNQILFFFNFFVVKVVDYLIFLSRLYLEFVVKILYLNFLGIFNGLFVVDLVFLSRLYLLMI